MSASGGVERRDSPPGRRSGSPGCARPRPPGTEEEDVQLVAVDVVAGLVERSGGDRRARRAGDRIDDRSEHVHQRLRDRGDGEVVSHRAPFTRSLDVLLERRELRRGHVRSSRACVGRRHVGPDLDPSDGHRDHWLGGRPLGVAAPTGPRSLVPRPVCARPGAPRRARHPDVTRRVVGARTPVARRLEETIHDDLGERGHRGFRRLRRHRGRRRERSLVHRDVRRVGCVPGAGSGARSAGTRVGASCCGARAEALGRLRPRRDGRGVRGATRVAEPAARGRPERWWARMPRS